MKCISRGRFCVAFCCGQFGDGAFQLNNTDHTSTVIDKVLEKYCIEDRPDRYCLLQMLPDGGLCTDMLTHVHTPAPCRLANTLTLSHAPCRHANALVHFHTHTPCWLANTLMDFHTHNMLACKHTDALSHAPSRHADTLTL